MKICKQCLIEKDIESFRIIKGAKYSSRLNKCKQCCREASMEPKEKERVAQYQKAYREKNSEKINAVSAAWQRDNRDRKAALSKRSRLKTKDKVVARQAAWQKNNKAAVTATVAKRNSAKLNRTPKWLTETDVWMIKEVYELAALRTKLTGVKCHVDHIIPLQGTLVSGLHIPYNMQVIPATENISKGNRFEVPI